MGVSREDVKKACKKAVDAMINPKIFFKAAEDVRDAMRITGEFFTETVNPVSSDELPFIIAILDSVVTRLRNTDADATKLADELKDAFGLSVMSIGMNSALAEAMRAMGRGNNNEKE